MRKETGVLWERGLCGLANKEKIPLSAVLELSPVCNMKCNMCYVQPSEEERKAMVPLRGHMEWLSLAEQMQKEGVLFVLLTGGEPLLYPGFWQLYTGLRSKGMILTVNTNGTRIDEEAADLFERYPPRRINVTLYGAGEAVYRNLCHYPEGFEKTINGIRLLKQRGIHVKINGSLTKENRKDAEKLIDIARSLEVPIKIDTYIYPKLSECGIRQKEESRLSPQEAAGAKVQIRKAEMTPEAFRQYAKFFLQAADRAVLEEGTFDGMKCRAGKSAFAVSWQGQLKPCVMFPDTGIDVFEKGFAASWRELVQWTEKIRLNSQCSLCTLQKICQVCAASAYREGGRYTAVPEYLCRYTEEFLKCLRKEAEN